MDPAGKQPTPVDPKDGGKDEEEKKRLAEARKKKNEEKAAAKAEKLKQAEEKKKQKEQQQKEQEQKPPQEKEKADEGKKKKEKTLRLKEEYVNTTPKGQKKDVGGKMADAYNPPVVEAAWYDWWREQGFFTADNNSKKEKFVIVIPPPNVTGSLHIGHALTNSIQDCIIRWNKMKGKEVLWVPGVDHAGISTQVVVEKKLMKERKVSRHDLGREPFIQEVWKWKEKYGERIKDQLMRLGSALDWTREAFTMDEKLSLAVTEAFVRLYEQGLIYRETRLVHWDSVLKTAVADIEVDKIDLTGPTKISVPGYPHPVEVGVLVLFAYKVEGTGEEVVIATTRVETMLADTGVAVHPNDERYKHLHGKKVVHPFNGRLIPIVTDGELVKMDFGTGVVKVTPAHDPNDYLCGKRHNLEFINMLNDDGTVNENGAPFQGLHRFEARRLVLEKLKEKGLFKEIKPNPMALGLCSRSKDVIEPRIKPQWWVNCKGMADAAVKEAREGRLQFFPPSYKETWYRWLENIHDWCISRQLWWGHRIPAYVVHVDGQAAPDEADPKNWVVARTFEEAKAKACSKFPNVDPSKIKLHQDPDVLDTWFSSGLFPFSTMGWPNNTQDLKAFYPTSLLETGHDILFFWVARMVMMGLNLTNSLPFNQVLLHAMVRDAHGRKMSKTLGNVIDPIDVIEGITLEGLIEKLKEGNLPESELVKSVEGLKKDFPNGITECGTDALRLALCAYTSQGKDINLDVNRVATFRNFCNKMWQATKFFFLTSGEGFVPRPDLKLSGHESKPELWILSRLNHSIEVVDRGIAAYELSVAATRCYDFFWDELCDVFLEAIKPTLFGEKNDEAKASARNTLYTCIETGLRLLHPFMPFITEELWQRLPSRPGAPRPPTIFLTAFPEFQPQWKNEQVEREMDLSKQIYSSFRVLRANYNVTPKTRPPAYLRIRTEELRKVLSIEWIETIKTLAVVGDIKILVDDPSPKGCAVDIINPELETLLNLEGIVNVEQEIKKLEGNITKLEAERVTIQKRMQAPQYEDKVPANVKEANIQRIKAIAEEIEKSKVAINDFKSLLK